MWFVNVLLATASDGVTWSAPSRSVGVVSSTRSPTGNVAELPTPLVTCPPPALTTRYGSGRPQSSVMSRSALKLASCFIDSSAVKVRFAVVQPTLIVVPGISAGPRLTGIGVPPVNSRMAQVTALTGTIAYVSSPEALMLPSGFTCDVVVTFGVARYPLLLQREFG